jgi:glutamine amidotransferase-like uncharacterized protein
MRVPSRALVGRVLSLVAGCAEEPVRRPASVDSREVDGAPIAARPAEQAPRTDGHHPDHRPASRDAGATPAAPAQVKVLIYAGSDAAPDCVDGAKQSLTFANSHGAVPGGTFSVKTTTVISTATLAGHDVLVMPGGDSGHSYRQNSNISGAAIRSFVAAGKGYFGTCAGAYAAAASTDGYYTGWGIAPQMKAKAVSYVGNLGVSITAAGTQVLSLAGALTLHHYNGAAMYRSQVSGPATPLADYADGSTGYKGYQAIISDTYGAGRSVLCGPHPELAPTQPALVARLVAWAAGH